MKQCPQDSLQTLIRQKLQHVGVSLENIEIRISAFWNNEEILSIYMKVF